jgi:hypothetical protein
MSFEVASGFGARKAGRKIAIFCTHAERHISSGRIGPSGLVVLKDGSVNGGDDGFAYRGTYNVEGQKVSLSNV